MVLSAALQQKTGSGSDTPEKGLIRISPICSSSQYLLIELRLHGYIPRGILDPDPGVLNLDQSRTFRIYRTRVRILDSAYHREYFAENLL